MPLPVQQSHARRVQLHASIYPCPTSMTISSFYTTLQPSQESARHTHAAFGAIPLPRPPARYLAQHFPAENSLLHLCNAACKRTLAMHFRPISAGRLAAHAQGCLRLHTAASLRRPCPCRPPALYICRTASTSPYICRLPVPGKGCQIGFTVSLNPSPTALFRRFYSMYSVHIAPDHPAAIPPLFRRRRIGKGFRQRAIPRRNRQKPLLSARISLRRQKAEARPPRVQAVA